MFNTTRQDQTFTIPADFLPLLKPGDPTHDQDLRARRPASTASATRTRPPAARSTSRRRIAATITIGGVITLDRLHLDRSGRQRHRRALEIIGAVGATIPYIGALSGTLNLNIYVGADQTGVVGRVFLARSDAGSIPGVSLTGQFLLEINTFASAQTIETFKIKKRGSLGIEFFDGFDARRAGQAEGRHHADDRHRRRLPPHARRRPEVRPADDHRRR